MAVTIGLDLGNDNTRICLAGEGIILNEPSVAAVDAEGNVLSVGRRALLTASRAPGTVTLRRPLENGVISDFDLTAEVLDRFLETAVPRTRKNVIAAVRCGLGRESRDLLFDALDDCSTGKISLIESPLCAAKYFGLRPDGDGGRDGAILCDVGADGTEAVYLRGRDFLRVVNGFPGGNGADSSIRDRLRRKYGLVVSPESAREAKHRLDLTSADRQPVTMRGLDAATGMPKQTEIPLTDLLNGAAPQIIGPKQCLERLLTNLPKQGGTESVAEKIYLYGGGVSLPGAGRYIGAKLERGITLAEQPGTAVIAGLQALLEE